MPETILPATSAATQRVPSARQPVLWATPVADLGGVARHIMDATETGVPGYEIVVLCPPGPLADLLRARDVEVIAADFGPDFGVLRSRRALTAAIRDVSPAIVHSHLAYADIISALTRIPAGVRRFSTEHGIAGDDSVYHRSRIQAAIMARVHRWRCRRFIGLLAVSKATRAAMIQKWRVVQPITVIPNGVDLPGDDARRSLVSVRGLRVLAISRLAVEKRIDLLLHAFALVHREHPQATLTIAGDGPLRGELRQLAVNLDITVSFVGFVDPVVAMRGADVVAQFSVWENCSYVLLDAVACGLRVVASDVGGNREIVGERNRVDPHDVEAAAAALIGAPVVAPDGLSSQADMTAAIARMYRTVGE